jgi:hypothetical protein
VICVEPLVLEEVIEEMPAIVASCRSIGVATVAAMISGLAPGRCRSDVDGREIDARQRRHGEQAIAETCRPE